ncbi:MAG TPA: hypothetical protein VL984_05445, partial [Acidimicrobiales bacterium]|nr:hypothetical protein [Acidimicrobiales bacterium]
DAPLVQFGDIHSPYSPYPGTLPLPEPEPGTIYSWALNNIWDTNFPTEQGGEMSFRYSITSSASLSAAELGARLGDEVSTPLVAALIPSAPSGKELPASGSICSVDRGEVRLVQATPSRDGRQLLLWLNNQADAEVSARVHCPDLEFATARAGTVFEDAQTELPVEGRAVTVTFKAGETRALALGGRLVFSPSSVS